MDKTHHNFEMEHPMALKLRTWLLGIYSNYLNWKLNFINSHKEVANQLVY